MIPALLSALQTGNRTDVFVEFFGYFLAIVIGISLHEFAHALVAYRLGDMTPVAQGRLTINPLAHFDPFGTLLILLVGFGYGRPVQVNPYAFRMDRRMGMALVSIAGPVTNIIIATVFAIGFRVMYATATIASPEWLNYVLTIFYIIISLNVGLAVFNMIPFPPLDGSKVLLALLPPDLAYRLERLYIQTQQFGFVILFIVFYAGSRFIGPILTAPTNAIVRLLTGQ